MDTIWKEEFLFACSIWRHRELRMEKDGKTEMELIRNMD